MTVEWRATGPYVASSALFSGILEETRLFLQSFAEQSGSVQDRIDSAKQTLIGGTLPQRSRSSRKSIAERITRRITTWKPPVWVLDDLAAFASQASPLSLKAALLMHVCRQDSFLYDLVQHMIVPKWTANQRQVDSADVQRFLDSEVPSHPEIESWSRQTRERLGSTSLAIMRDYGLLEGKTRKQIVEPIVPEEVILHVVNLLRAEGISETSIPEHPDWCIWLWDEARIARVLTDQALR